jgi:uncharacterized protein (DUF433 family)
MCHAGDGRGVCSLAIRSAPVGLRLTSPKTVSGMLGVVSVLDLIEVRPGVRGDKPCFVGTRITVYDVLEYLAGGMSPSEIVVDFPELTEPHVRAALEFAALRERRLAVPA